MKNARRAVIDVGTNSIKLLVADVMGREVKPVWEDSKQTRLGSGFYETHRLQPEAIARTAQAVALFAAKARDEKADSLRVIATSAARDAVNPGELTSAIEQASGLIHTLRFGNHYREAVGAKSYLCFINTRGPANAPIAVPLMDKNDAGRRSHYLTLQFSIADAPRADEVVVVLGGATGGRPHHRIGDRYQDLKELDRGHDNPAGV